MRTPSRTAKKRGLTDSHLQCATTGTSQRKRELNEVASLDGGYTDLAVAAVHRELNEKDGTAIRCQICHPYSVKPLWTLLAKFVACRTPGGWPSMTSWGNSVDHESFYNDSEGIYWWFTSNRRQYIYSLKYPYSFLTYWRHFYVPPSPSYTPQPRTVQYTPL